MKFKPKIFEKINFNQPKYVLPAIIYLPLIFAGYFILKLFDTEKIEIDTMETTEYYNDKLPEANIKGDGIGDKYTNMLNDFGKIKDESAVENIERGEDDQKEEYTSQYDAPLEYPNQIEELEEQNSLSDTERAMEKLQQIRKQLREQTVHDSYAQSTSPDEDATLENLRKALAEARGVPITDEERKQVTTPNNEPVKDAEEPDANKDVVKDIADDAQVEEVVRRRNVASDYFNTISENAPEPKIIRAIVDEDILAMDGSRMRLRLLDEIDVGGRVLPSGTNIYCMVSGLGQQRVKGNIQSVLVNDELVKVNLRLYDTDGLEGLYVPKSAIRETSKDVAGNTLNQSVNFNNGEGNSSFKGWGIQALQNAYQKTTGAISKNVKKNKVKIKYGTQVYLVNARKS